MQVEPAQAAGQDVARQDPYGQLVAFAQAFGQGDPDVPARQAHLVRQFLGGVVQIGEMVAPALDFAARGGQRIVSL